MTRIKLCGLSRPCDVQAANELSPEYIGFVFAPKSRRFVSVEKAKELKALLSPDILAVGVFVNSPERQVAELLNSGVIDIAQLHGSESEEYIARLRALTDKGIIKAFALNTKNDALDANASSADWVLLDSANGGSGRAFDRSLLKYIDRNYFLAGGLDAFGAAEAVRTFSPFAVDVSSGIETAGVKDKIKMAEFVRAVRLADGRED